MIYQQPAFVLHRRPYRETSLMLTLFTPDFGKLQATVKGVRGTSKAAAQKQAWLQPFQALNVTWRAQQHDVDWISPQTIEPQGAPWLLQGEANVCGLYLNELLYRLLQPNASMEKLFVLYHQSLARLAHSENRQHQAWCLRQFELGLLAELGYEIDLSHDYQTQPIRADQHYVYQTELGFVPANTLQSPTILGDCLNKLAKAEFCEHCLTEWKRLMRQVLQPHLGHKPLASRQLFPTRN